MVFSPATSGYGSMTVTSNRITTAGLISGIMVYPGLLSLFYWTGRQATSTEGLISILAWTGVILFLLAIFAVPVTGLVIALKYGRRNPFTTDDLRLRNIAHFAVAVPPLYSATGAYFILFGISGYDPYVWVTVWFLVLMIMMIKTTDGTSVDMRKRVPPRWLRISHGAIAAVVIIGFIALHLLHNVTGLMGADFYDRLQEVLRDWYRAPLVEPVIIVAFLFMMVSGIALLSFRTASFGDPWGTLLTTSGAYIGAFLLAHMTAALLVARWKFGVETNWDWAAGAPKGLFADPWSVRLIPYYVIAPMAVIVHAACGLRVVLTDRGSGIRRYERLARVIMATAVLIALLIIAALLGLRVT